MRDINTFNYIDDLKDLVCQTDGQVDVLVKNVLRPEDIRNGNRPNGPTTDVNPTDRFLALMNVDPKHRSKSIDDGTSSLLPSKDGIELNNNPNYRPNMIEVLNTPFDHIERIILQDFSDVLLPTKEVDGKDKKYNYFKGLFTFPASSSDVFHGGFSGFEMNDSEGIAIFTGEGGVNDRFNSNDHSSEGGFFIDSFTYTPFVDYSQVDEGGDSCVGVYSDQFLTDYNTGKYDVVDNQVDKNRHKMSSKLYELRNLKKDLEDAKVAFRDAITYKDGQKIKTNQVYIYTLCEHLATLFAKLSNIRMSHEIYGFKYPHAQWEGILALDIFYNSLYKEIDAKYAFDDKFMCMNPMQRRTLYTALSDNYVLMDNDRKLWLKPDGSCAWDNDGESVTVANDLEWMPDEISNEFVYIWNSGIWNAYYNNSQRITDERKEFTTPRGVLKRLYHIVKGLEYKWQSYFDQRDDSDNDYKWFKQSGKIYTHWNDKSLFTKYTNLHLGRAYEVMTGKEYYELTGVGRTGDGAPYSYTKPNFSDLPITSAIEDGLDRRKMLDQMMQRGFLTLVDAFTVIQNEHLFNIFNFNTKSVDGFIPANADNYSQGQCAIVIERIFSRIYKYLQFKSTTSETFQRHINIDSGYKYLTTESLKNSDHELNYYYDPTDEQSTTAHPEPIKPYLRYLKKLNEYANSTELGSGIGLTTAEQNVLGEFCKVLSKKALDWLNKKWDLCPLLQRASENIDGFSPRKSISKLLVRDGGGDDDSVICQSSSDAMQNWKVIRSAETGEPYIVYKEDETDHPLPIKANFAKRELQQFKVTFIYMNDEGNRAEHEEYVDQNQYLPKFHIHNKYVKGESTFTFKYWLLESGNLTSSLTVLSDLVFVAIYDETKNIDTHHGESDSTGKGSTIPEADQVKITTSLACSHCKPYTPTNGHTHQHYCDLNGLNPHGYYDNFDELGDCPYVKLMRELYASETVTKDSIFRETAIIEISDLANLFKALFKVNIDIAHREYFLKIDVPEASNWWYGYLEDGKWYSFEPEVELKFSNLHSDNQLNDERDHLICTTKSREDEPVIMPVNRELSYNDSTNKCVQYNDLDYFYDYRKAVQSVGKCDVDSTQSELIDVTPLLDDNQKFYEVKPLCLYENTQIQSPIDINDFIKHRLEAIQRTTKQVQTFTSFVKKYRPVIMPNVRDIFNDCTSASDTKYDADINNSYGVFGWCTIPSKTMVNMEYNEGALYVPSSYDHHNHVCGSNFLQMDNDFKKIYQVWIPNETYMGEDVRVGHLEDNAQRTWVWLYNTRDWTYFTKPFFDVGRNNEVYSNQLDVYGYLEDGYLPENSNTNVSLCPINSNHLNGVVFEKSTENRSSDLSFLGIVTSCQFLARYHHNEKNLKVLSERYTNLLSYAKLKELTSNSVSEFNDVYGSEYPTQSQQELDITFPESPRFPFTDWIDDYDKTDSFVGLGVDKYKPGSENDGALKYRYNLGQAHAIDDFDEDSVWFYITMVSPLEELDSVIELEDIMPYVFWWENRGTENNGPTVDCYGKSSSAKLNYEQGGWCYSMAHERQDEDVQLDVSLNPPVEKRIPKLNAEHSWHAVSNTLGVDFSKKENGGTLLTSDNSGNVYKGAFDPNCAGTDEKWKVHHLNNAFGANQHEDPIADKYYLGENAHGDTTFSVNVSPKSLNDDIMDSIKDRPMTWNLWNVVRHYVYIKYFKNRHKVLGSDEAAWAELEKYTKKLVKGIYRTFKDSKKTNDERSTFADIDGTPTNYGGTCHVKWTNSFIEATTILERNAREHDASFVLFTGDIPRPNNNQLETARNAIQLEYGEYNPSLEVSDKLATARYSYEAIVNSSDSFRVTTNEGVDADDSGDGMRPRKMISDGKPYEGYKAEDDTLGVRVFQGFKYGDLPTTYVIGDGVAYAQRQQDTLVNFSNTLDLDKMYPEAEYYLDDKLRKWVRKILGTVLNRQILPVYTSMENMDKDVHSLTEKEMKSITFQVVPSFYWRYEQSYNEFMIHRVGKLNSPSKEPEMYDMLGNVWEWVRDDWSPTISALNGKVNPIVSSEVNSNKKVIKGGSFDQLLRKVVSSAREELAGNESRSKFGTQSNVGFRPSLTFIAENAESGEFVAGETQVDLFFLYDASASQDNAIQTMLHSTLKIIDAFSSPDPSKDICHVGSALFLGNNLRLMCSNQVETLDQTIWVERITQVNEYRKGNAPAGFVPSIWYTYSNDEDCPYILNKVPDTEGVRGRRVRGGLKDNTDTEKYSDWISVSTGQSISQIISRIGDGISEDRSNTGLKVKFTDYKDNKWMCGTSSTQSRDIFNESNDFDDSTVQKGILKKSLLKQMSLEVEQEENKTLKYSDVSLMKGAEILSMRDAGGGGGDHPSTGGGDGGEAGPGSASQVYVYSTIQNSYYKKWLRHLAVHTGVPTWGEDITTQYKNRHPDWRDEKNPSEQNVIRHESNGNVTYKKLHFGEIPMNVANQYDWYFVPDEKLNDPNWRKPDEWVNPFTKSFDFFTNDLTSNGISTYSWPFFYNPDDTTTVYRSDTNKMESVFAYKGVLTNMWRGCEPVCAITSKLLKDGYFFSYPCNHGLGYMFRKKPVVKILFVFANEYDNSYTADYSYEGGFQFNTTVVVPGMKNRSSAFFCSKRGGILGGDEQKEAIDPYCMKQLSNHTPESALNLFNEYMETIGIGENTQDKEQMLYAIQDIINEANLGSISDDGYTEPQSANVNINGWTIGSEVNSSSSISYYDYYTDMDLDRNDKPFKDMDITQLLTKQQMDAFKNEGKFPGITYARNERLNRNVFVSCKYYVPKTVGFYQLRNTFAKLDEPVNTYLMVSDANAPSPVYDTDISDKDADWWADQNNALEIAGSLYLFQDSKLFVDTIGDIEIKGDFGRKLFKCINRRDYTTRDKFYKWKDLWTYNFDWHWLNKIPGTNIDPNGLRTLQPADAKDIYAVFQSFNNPYINNNIILATRFKYGTFDNAIQRAVDEPNRGSKFWWNNQSIKWEGAIQRNGDNNEHLYGYLFMLGLEPCQTGKVDRTTNKVIYTGWKSLYYNVSGKADNQQFRNMLMDDIICDNVYPNGRPAHAMTKIWNYATNNPEFVDADISDEGKAWIDKHLCPYYLWDSDARKNEGKFCKYNCTVENMEHIAIAAVDVYKSENSQAYLWPDYPDGNNKNLLNPMEDSGTYDGSIIATDIYALLMSQFLSALSVRMKATWLYSVYGGVDTFSPSNYVLSKPPTSYITIDYHNGVDGPVTGSLKIVVLDESINLERADQAIFPDNGGLQSQGITINAQGSLAYYTITQTNTCAYPIVWGKALQQFAKWYYDNKLNKKIPTEICNRVWGCATQESRDVVRYTKLFYDNLKKAMPCLLAYRYQNEILGEYTNISGKSLVDYEDTENTIIAKALPIMDASLISDTFKSSFDNGNFEGSEKQFTYSHCIIDLNPNLDNYNTSNELDEFKVQKTQFPMRLVNGVNVNINDYKTNKMVLTRVDKISGEKFDTFVMGSHSTDYNQIVGQKVRKYKDPEAIVDGAIDDYATITLGNGGSYQKKYPNRNLSDKDHPILSDDLYDANLEESNDERRVEKRDPETGAPIPGKYETKYFKNKHFFIDPFAVTIAQWCYVKLNSNRSQPEEPTRDQARALLSDEGHLSGETGIEKSYWKYLSVWEKEEWKETRVNWIKQNSTIDSDAIEFIDKWKIEHFSFIEDWKESNPKESSETEQDYNDRAQFAFDSAADTAAQDSLLGKDDDWWQTKFIKEEEYDPLQDTRPYYYATYNDVRGTGQVYVDRDISTGKKYIIDSEKGDEFQMNSRNDDTLETLSFMDILNHNVVFQTQKRIYGNAAPDTVENYESAIDGATGSTIDEKVDNIKGAEYDSLGESPLLPFLMNARDNKKGISKSDRTKYWCSGKEGGINFDLPTEAQWEYCCRMGSTTAIPQAYNLGDNFEENFEPLDLIAWYKYKVVGSLPEPERFCAWRISKMIFGIGKDKEQINNVYETDV